MTDVKIIPRYSRKEREIIAEAANIDIDKGVLDKSRIPNSFLLETGFIIDAATGHLVLDEDYENKPECVGLSDHDLGMSEVDEDEDELEEFEDEEEEEDPTAELERSYREGG